LLDVKSEGPVVSDKRHANKMNKPVVPGILRDNAQPQVAHKKRAVGHQSWADVVKSRPRNDLGNSRQLSNKR
jgi:hypothetical protein